MVQVGDTVRDFTLVGTDGETIQEYTLSEVADGRPIMLVFYVYDFSPICNDQMCEVNDMEMLTFNNDAAVLGISPDGPFSHQEFARDSNITYPLLSDSNREVYKQFGLFDEDDDPNHQRAIVLLDGDLTVQYRWVAEDTFAEWSIDPLNEANEIINELL